MNIKISYQRFLPCQENELVLIIPQPICEFSGSIHALRLILLIHTKGNQTWRVVVEGYNQQCLEVPTLMARPESLQIELGIHHRLESFVLKWTFMKKRHKHSKMTWSINGAFPKMRRSKFWWKIFCFHEEKRFYGYIIINVLGLTRAKRLC